MYRNSTLMSGGEVSFPLRRTMLTRKKEMLHSDKRYEHPEFFFHKGLD